MSRRIGSSRKLLASAAILALLLNASCRPQTSGSQADQVSREAQQLVLKMRNADVDWDGTYVGLLPMTLTGPALTLRDTEEPIEPLLVEALLDEERYVAAHVLLTIRTESSFTGTASDWNGLRVRLFADGSVSYAGNDLAALHQQWAEKLADEK